MNRFPLKLAVLAGLALSFAGVSYAPQAAARTQVSIGIGIAPPPPRFEQVPPARRGYVWAPGYWRWDRHAHRHVWAGGYWMQVRPGYRYQPAHWVHGRGDWRFQPGRWTR